VNQPIRVVQWGTGNTGSVALQAIRSTPGLDLIGVWAHNPELAGRDAAELLGLDTSIGVPIWSTAADVVATVPDCVCYMATERGRRDEVIDEFCLLLAAGINVVTTTHPLLVHPDGDGPDVRRRIENACASGNSSFLCTGVEPGFMADALVLHLTSLSRDITRIHVQEAMNVGGYRGGRWRSGLGNDIATDGQRYIPGSIAQNWMGPMLMLADALNVTLDKVYESREITSAEREFTVPGTVRHRHVQRQHPSRPGRSRARDPDALRTGRDGMSQCRRTSPGRQLDHLASSARRTGGGMTMTATCRQQPGLASCCSGRAVTTEETSRA
jgi:4-hydroxy-tetrahydrodipicolinate reductase